MHKKKKKKENFKRNIISILTMVVILSTFGIYSINAKNNVKLWSNKIYPEIKVEGINLTNKSEDEAKDILKKEFSDKILNKKLIVRADNKNIEIKYSDLDPKYDIEKAIKEAMSLGKDNNIYFGNKNIKKGINTNIKLDFTYNKEKLKVFEEKLKSTVNKVAKNATLTINNGTPHITDGINGRKINDEQMSKIINDSINGEISEETSVDIPVEEEIPKIKKDDLAKVNGIIGTFSTDFPANQQEGRKKNLEIGSSKLNGKIIAPDETFSFNNTVGERTYKNGFDLGGVFKDNKLVDEVGGGICQVSTTLYRAVMNAGILPTERHNHSFGTSYSKYGLDATVYFGSLDYKFKNTYKSPIYIESYVQNKKVVFNIYGNASEKGNKTYDLVAEDCKTLSNGKIQVTSYFITKQDGKEILKQKIATDVYGKL